MKNQLLLLIMVLFTSPLLAQQSNCSYSASGVLSDKQTGEKLPFASIYFIELQQGVGSNDSGYFEFKGLCDGTYTVRIEHLGCHPLTRKITVQGANIILNIELDHSAHELGEVEIAAHREEKPVGRVSESLEGISLRKAQGDNLGNMLSNLSGVNVIQTGSSISKPVIHGMHSNRVLVLNNGIRQEGQQWGAEHAPEIDPFIARKLTVIKGANTIKYGADAIAGVILVEPGELPDTTGISGELSAGAASNGRLGNASALVEGNLKEVRNLKFRLQGTLRKAGNLNTPDYYLENTGLSEKNFSGALAYSIKRLQVEAFYSQFNTKIGIYTGSHLGNTTDLIRLYSSNAKPEGTRFSYDLGRPYQQLLHELMKVKAKWTLKNFNSISLTYSRQFNRRYEFDRHGSRNDSIAALNRPEFQYFITTHMLDAEYQLHHHNDFEGAAGITGMTQANTYNGRQFIPNFRNQGVGVYWIERYHSGNWQIEAGARFDHRFLEVFKAESNGNVVSPSFTYNNPSISLGLNYRMNEFLVLTAFSGTAWRPPAVNELYSNGLHHGSATIETGDASLRPESNWNNSISATYASTKFSGELSLYHNTLTGFINLIPSGQTSLTIRGAFPSYIYVQQNAIFKGIDASGKLAIGEKTFVSAQYNMVRASVRGTRNFLSQIPADRSRLAIERRFTTGKQDINFSVGLNYVARQTRYAEQQVITQEGGKLIEVRDFAPPPSDYFLVDAELSSNLTIGKQSILVSLSGSNLFNRRYRNYMNRFRYFSDEIGRNIQLRINIPFTIKPH